MDHGRIWSFDEYESTTLNSSTSIPGTWYLAPGTGIDYDTCQYVLYVARKHNVHRNGYAVMHDAVEAKCRADT